MSEPLAQVLCDRLAVKAQLVSSAEEFVAAPREPHTISFVDDAALESVDRMAAALGSPTDPAHATEWRQLHSAVSAPTIAIGDVSVATMLGWLPARPWVSHVISAAMLESAMGKDHLANVIELCTSREPKLLDWLRPSSNGRRVRLTHAKRRSERLERMGQFFAAQSVEGRRIMEICKATDEMMVNAFYEAPVAAGACRRVDRSRDIALPEELAVDIAYCCLDELAVVRVRDPFGALSREAFIDALTRRARDPNAAETGFWRLAAGATILAVCVIQNRHTEVLVAIPKRDGGRSPAFALHFASRLSPRSHFWKVVSETTGDTGEASSVSLVISEESTSS